MHDTSPTAKSAANSVTPRIQFVVQTIFGRPIRIQFVFVACYAARQGTKI
jgi:hypothetical protein